MPDRIEMLSAYVDGDLSPEETAAIERELETSAELRAELDALREMKALAKEDLATPPDLWPAISREVAPPKKRFRPPRWAYPVAAVAVAAALALFFLRPPPAPVETPQLGDRLAAARTAYMQAIGDLAKESEAATEKLPPESRQKLAESLFAVDEAIRETEAALKTAPNDPFGHETLLSLYEEKVRVLNAAIEASRLGGPS